MLIASLLTAALGTSAFIPAADQLSEATSLKHQGKLDQASVVLAEALDAGEGDERELRLALADVRILLKLPDEALAALAGLDDDDSAVALAKGRATLVLADALAASGATNEEVEQALGEGRALLEHAVALGDGGAPVWELGNVLLYRYNELDRTLNLADEALAANPNDGEALLLRGAAGAYVYWGASQSGDIDGANQAWSSAVADLEKADDLLGKFRLEPLGQLVWFYEAQDISGKAVETAIKLSDRQPEPDYSELYRLARKYRDNGRLEPSGKALEHIVNSSPRDLTQLIKFDGEGVEMAAVKLADSVFPFYERGDRATCRTILRAITAADPPSASVWSNYAVICVETSRFDDAVTAYERSIDLDPNNPRTYTDLASVYQHNLRRNNDRSKKLYEDCIALADKQLAMLDASPEIKSNASDAKRIAQDNMRQLSQASGSSGGLLDSMVKGLRGLNLPKSGDDDSDEEGEEDEGSTEG